MEKYIQFFESSNEDEITLLIKNLIDKYNYDFYGLRSDYIVDNKGYIKNRKNLKIGMELPNSSVWEDGSITNEELPGVSASAITPHVDIVDGIQDAFYYQNLYDWGKYGYSGNILLLIGGNSAQGGEDPGEIIISNAKVLCIFKKIKSNGQTILKVIKK